MQTTTRETLGTIAIEGDLDNVHTPPPPARNRLLEVLLPLHAAIAATIQTWHPVSAGLPDSDTTVIIYAPEADEPIWLGYHDGEAWMDISGLTLEWPVIHWMQLPEPPSQ